MPGTSFEVWLRDQLARAALPGPFGRALAGAIGRAMDELADRARQAAKARLVTVAPDDALVYHGRDRRIECYPADTDASYRARLVGAWDAWQLAGTYQGIPSQLAAAGFAPVALYDVWTAPSWWVGAWPPPPFGTAPSWWVDPWPPAAGDPTVWWSRFWVELTAPGPFAWSELAWGSAWKYGRPDAAPYTWGSTATAAEVALVRSIIAKWKKGAGVCAGIFVRFPSGRVLTWRA